LLIGVIFFGLRVSGWYAVGFRTRAIGHKQTLAIPLQSRRWPRAINRKRSFGWGCQFPRRAGRPLRSGKQPVGVGWRLAAAGQEVPFSDSGKQPTERLLYFGA